MGWARQTRRIGWGLALLLGTGLPVAAEDEPAKDCAIFHMELIDPALPQERESVWLSRMMTREEAREVLAGYHGEDRLEIICKDDPAWEARMPNSSRWVRIRIQAD